MGSSPPIMRIPAELRNQIYHIVFEDVPKTDEKAKNCACKSLRNCPHTWQPYKSIDELKQYTGIIQTNKQLRDETHPILFKHYMPQVAWSISGGDSAPARLVSFVGTLPKGIRLTMQLGLEMIGTERDEAIVQRNNALAANTLATICASDHGSPINMRVTDFHTWLYLHRYRSLPLGAHSFTIEAGNTESYDFEFKVGHNASHHCLIVAGPLAHLVDRWSKMDYFQDFEKDRKDLGALSLLTPVELDDRYMKQPWARLMKYLDRQVFDAKPKPKAKKAKKARKSGR